MCRKISTDVRKNQYKQNPRKPSHINTFLNSYPNFTLIYLYGRPGPPSKVGESVPLSRSPLVRPSDCRCALPGCQGPGSIFGRAQKSPPWRLRRPLDVQASRRTTSVPTVELISSVPPSSPPVYARNRAPLVIGSREPGAAERPAPQTPAACLGWYWGGDRRRIRMEKPWAKVPGLAIQMNRCVSSSQMAPRCQSGKQVR